MIIVQKYYIRFYVAGKDTKIATQQFRFGKCPTRISAGVDCLDMFVVVLISPPGKH